MAELTGDWDLLLYVADHYSSRNEKFLSDYQNLEQMRLSGGSPIDLEENKERVKMRIAREGGYKVATERIMGINDHQEVYILNILYQLSKSVCRITCRGQGIGTGFLVAENIILTNHHVIPSERDGSEMAAEFDFQLTPPPDRSLMPSVSFACNPDAFFLTSTLEENENIPFSGLDFTLIAIKATGTRQRRIQEFTPVRLDGNIGKIIKGESCVIIQHPEGRPKKVALKNAAFFSETKTRIVYETDTLPGSSGSMVVALGTGEIIALHHAGLPATDRDGNILTKYNTIADATTREQDIKWIGNQGIKISEIVKAITGSKLNPEMEPGRKLLLRKTEQVANQLKKTTDSILSDREPNLTAQASKVVLRANKVQDANHSENNTPIITTMDNQNNESKKPVAFLFTAIYQEENITLLTSLMQAKFGTDTQVSLSMPASAKYGEEELFTLEISKEVNPRELLRELLLIPGVVHAEWDCTLQLNATPHILQQGGVLTTESFLKDDGYGEPNEDKFLKKYAGKSKYINPLKNEGDEETATANRKWNWVATGFDKAYKEGLIVCPHEKGVRIVQFDTGYSNHTKVLGGFDTEHYVDFVGDDDTPDDALDSNSIGFLKMPGHGTRTGSILIGRSNILIDNDGNPGLLEGNGNFTLAPYRIAKSVILINRQQELAAALDYAIQQGFDVITMSMGLPPTLATAKMVKKAYDAGIIWCCAAGNEVKFVVAPAVFPGTIAVAASNPMDELWQGSSRGDTVDITAPGEDVYVPIMYKDKKDGNKPKEGFAYGNGTSYATPHVAAAAALWLAKYKTELNDKAYQGWRRIEAFRIALTKSARKKPEIKVRGHGEGILDVYEMLKKPPQAPGEANNKYNSWNEKAFFATLKGMAEIAKTYWNELHQSLRGRKKSIQESYTGAMALTEEDRMLESVLFGNSISPTESSGLPTEEELLERLAIINQKLFNH